LTRPARSPTLRATMLGTLRQLVVGLAILVLLRAPTTAEEPDLGPVPRAGVLLLRNGQAIEGKIARAGDLYYVALPGGEIRIQVADVELCCRSLEEGYWRKRAAAELGNVHDHLRLAQWCLRHGLFG
jgi:hypothetical protein